MRRQGKEMVMEDNLTLFGEVETRKTTKKPSNGRGRRPRKAQESRVVKLFSQKLQKLYGYGQSQLVQPALLQDVALAATVSGCSLVVLSRDYSPYMVVDCWSEKSEDARKAFSSRVKTFPNDVEYAVWTNGSEHLFLRRSGKRAWKEVPDLPREGETLEDIGRLRRSELVVPESLLAEFTDIRNHLAANAVGVTRDETIAREVLKLLFCKMYDERHRSSDDYVEFCAYATEDPEEVKKRIESRLLTNVLRSGELGSQDENGWNGAISLDAESVAYTVGLLQRYEITQAKRDVIGQAFESLIGSALRGEEGQFFTPRNVVHMMVGMIAPKRGERIIDPACGSGGFLAAVSERMAGASTQRKTKKKKLGKEKTSIVGIEKDTFLATIARAYMSVLGEASAQVFNDDSLKRPSQWKRGADETCELSTFDVVLTNPPFGAKIPVKGEQTLRQYELARVWKKSKDRSFQRSKELSAFRPPQILFIERCLDLLKEGGRMAIVLPDGILGNVNDGYVRQFVAEKADVIAIVDCPLETFLPSTPTKTSILLLRKKAGKESRENGTPVFMAIAEKCGHDRRGKPLVRPDGTIDDDFPDIVTKFEEWKRENNVGL